MHSHQIQIVLLLLSFIGSLFLLIASAKYAEWARAMIGASGSWLGLVAYIGSIPLLSLTITSLHILALHFDLLPSHLPSGHPISSKFSHSQTGYTVQPRLYLFALATTILQSIMWLGQASLCTACELAPILAGTQGNVPGWCPQSHFRDTGKKDLPMMLSQLATVKDIAQWIMFPLFLALVECTRRQWARARIASVEQRNWAPGLREYDWKSGVVVAAVGTGGEQLPEYEMEPVSNTTVAGAAAVSKAGLTGKGKPLPMVHPGETNPGAVEIGGPPTRQNTGFRGQGEPVRTGMGFPASYESRI